MANNVRFSSFNVTGFKPRNYDFLKSMFSKCDVLLLQETWLYNSQQNIIRDVLKGSQCHAVSAMSDMDVGRVGRPYGGCAVVWRSSLPPCGHHLPQAVRRGGGGAQLQDALGICVHAE